MKPERQTLTMTSAARQQNKDEERMEKEGKKEDEKGEHSSILDYDVFRGLWRYVFGYLAACGSAVSSSISVIAVQPLQGFIPPFQLNFWRYLPICFIFVPWVLIKRNYIITGEGARNKIIGLVVFSVLCQFFFITLFDQVLYISVANAAGLSGTVSFACVFLGSLALRVQKWSWVKLALVLVCIGGCLILTQPDFIFGASTEPAAPTYSPHCLGESTPSVNLSATFALANGTGNQSMFSNETAAVHNRYTDEETLGYLISFSNGVLQSIIMLVTNLMLREIDVSLQCATSSLFGVIFSGICASCLETWILPTNPFCIVLLMAHVLAALCTLATFQISLRLLRPIEVRIVYCSQLVILLVAQYTFLADIAPGNRNSLEVLGACVVCLSIIASSLHEWFSNKEGRMLLSE